MFPVHQVPHPAHSLAPGVEQEDPGGVLGQSWHHHQVADHMQIWLSLEHEDQMSVEQNILINE